MNEMAQLGAVEQVDAELVQRCTDRLTSAHIPEDTSCDIVEHFSQDAERLQEFAKQLLDLLPTKINGADGNLAYIAYSYLARGGMGATFRVWNVKEKRVDILKISFVTNEEPTQKPEQPATNNATIVQDTCIVEAEDVESTGSVDVEEASGSVNSDDFAIANPDAAALPNAVDTASVSSPNSLSIDISGFETLDSEALAFEVYPDGNSPERTVVHSVLLECDELRKAEALDASFNMELSFYRNNPDWGMVDHGKFNGNQFLVLRDKGLSLRDIAKESPEQLSEDAVRHIALLFIKRLYQLHQESVVHYDIKPHNVMLDANGQVDIIDFGLSDDLIKTSLQDENMRLLFEDLDTILKDPNIYGTMAAKRLDANSRFKLQKRLKGTMAYMAPESANLYYQMFSSGRDAPFKDVLEQEEGPESDVYSLAKTVYNLATGQDSISPSMELPLTESQRNDNPNLDRESVNNKRILELIGLPSTYESEEFKRNMAKIKDPALREGIERAIRLKTEERIGLKELAKLWFKGSSFEVAYNGNFDAWWQAQGDTIPGLDGNQELTAATINAAIAAHLPNALQKHVLVPGHKIARYVLENKYLVAAVLGVTGTVVGSAYQYTRMQARAAVEHRAETGVESLGSLLLSPKKPTQFALNSQVTRYNFALAELPERSNEFRAEIDQANADGAFIIEYAGNGITSIQPNVDYLVQNMSAELVEQVKLLDGTAQCLDQLTLEQLNTLYAAVKQDRFAVDASTLVDALSGLIPEGYVLQVNGTIHIEHAAEQKDSQALVESFANLDALLQTEDGPHTERCQRQLQVVNALIANWQHRTAVLDTIEEAGLQNLPEFIASDYDEDSADILLSNKVEAPDEHTKILHTRFGSYTVNRGTVVQIKIDEDVITVPVDLYAFKNGVYYSSGFLNKEDSESIFNAYSENLESANLDYRDFSSIGLPNDQIIFGSNKVQGFLIINLKQNTMKHVENIKQFNDPEVLSLFVWLQQIDFKGLETIKISDGLDRNTMDDEMKKFVLYLGQYVNFRNNREIYAKKGEYLYHVMFKASFGNKTPEDVLREFNLEVPDLSDDSELF